MGVGDDTQAWNTRGAILKQNKSKQKHTVQNDNKTLKERASMEL